MTPFLRPFFIWNKFLCSLVCLLFCVQVGAKKCETLEVVSKLPEVRMIKVLEFSVNISNTRISLASHLP